MSLAHSPRIITDGLVLCLDAGNTKSYPGSGTTWTDLSGNGNNGTLENGVGYSGGSLSFDGVDDYVNATNSILNVETGTIDAWVKCNNPLDGIGEVVVARTNVSTGTFNILKGATPNTWRSVIRLSGTNTQYTINSDSVATTDWTHIVTTYDGTTQKIFINSVQQTTTNSISGTLNTAGTLEVRMGMNTNSSGMLNGNLAVCRIYNKALTASEIQQNFNALRGRFGI
jgi:hypothetical protein